MTFSFTAVGSTDMAVEAEVWAQLPGSNSSLASAKPGGNSANSSLPEVKSFRRVRPARVSSGSPFADDQPLPTATDLNSSAAVGGLHHLQAVSPAFKDKEKLSV